MTVRNWRTRSDAGLLAPARYLAPMPASDLVASFLRRRVDPSLVRFAMSLGPRDPRMLRRRVRV